MTQLSPEQTRVDDGNYLYELHKQGNRLIISIRSMHSMCRKAKPIKITVPSDIDYYIDLSKCFDNHARLTDISALSSFDSSRVVNMSEMFSRCRKLESIEPISNWDVSNVWDMTGIFYSCPKLTDLTCLSNWKVSDDCILHWLQSVSRTGWPYNRTWWTEYASLSIQYQ